MKPLAWGVAVALLAGNAPAISSQPVPAVPQDWGPSTDGLRLGISTVSSGKQPASGAQFYVAVQNTGDSDFVLNLGAMLANGKVMFPDAVRFTLTGPAGQTRELHFMDRRYPAVAGRLDDFTVALRNGAFYGLRLSLDQYWSPQTREFVLKLADGRYRIAARFQGRGAQTGNSDMHGVALLNFWRGTVQSNSVDFEVSQQVASK